MTEAEIYFALRYFSETWGLALTVVMFLALVAWPFRPSAKQANDAAARMIFEEDGHD